MLIEAVCGMFIHKCRFCFIFLHKFTPTHGDMWNSLCHCGQEGGTGPGNTYFVKRSLKAYSCSNLVEFAPDKYHVLHPSAGACLDLLIFPKQDIQSYK